MEGKGKILCQAGVQHGPLQRGFVVAGEVVGKDGDCIIAQVVIKGGEHGGAGDDGPLGGILLRPDGKGHCPLRGGHRTLHGNLESGLLPLVWGEEAVNLGQTGIQIHAAHQRDAGVGGVVIFPMFGKKLLVGQLGNVFRIAS